MIGPQHVVSGLLALGGGYGYALGPMDPAADQPRYLDNGQFAALVFVGAIVVFLLAVIAVGQWRR